MSHPTACDLPLDLQLASRLPLFAELDERLLARIAAISSTRSAAAGDLLFDVGEHPSCLFVLRAGQVALRTRTGNDLITIEVMRAGDVFPIPTVLLNRPSLMVGQALEPAELVCVAAADLRGLLRSEPSMAMTMLVSVSTGYRALVRQIADLKSRSVAQRLGCYLLTLATEQGNGQEITLPFEKRLLAARLGTTPESLSRALGILRTCGVSTHGRKVTLGNVPVLARFARPDDLT